MPGIPDQGTIDAHTFALSFWSALYSGIIYSILTGIVVGIVVWIIQVKAENRREKKDIEKQLSFLIPKLKPPLNQEDVTTVDNIESCIQTQVVDLIPIIDQYPLEMWKNKLSTNCLIKTLCNTQQYYLNAQFKAKKLNVVLKGEIRSFNVGKAPLNDEPLYVYFVGKTFEFEDKELIPFLHLSNDIPEWVKDFYDHCSENKQLENITNEFLEERKKLDTNIEELKSLLN